MYEIETVLMYESERVLMGVRMREMMEIVWMPVDREREGRRCVC